MTQECNHCNEPAHNRCARCQQVCYCSKTCQTDDWKTHRKQCSKNTNLVSVARHYFHWNEKQWEHSFPGFSDDGLSVSCFGRDSLVTSSNPFTAEHDYCAVRVFTYSDKLRVGVCTKNAKTARVHQMWMFSTAGVKFGPRALEEPYGNGGYKTGDVVGIRVRDNWIAFEVNGAPLGVAFDNVKDVGKLYLCVFLNNAFNAVDPENLIEGGELFENRPSAVQIVA